MECIVEWLEVGRVIFYHLPLDVLGKLMFGLLMGSFRLDGPFNVMLN